MRVPGNDESGVSLIQNALADSTASAFFDFTVFPVHCEGQGGYYLSR